MRKTTVVLGVLMTLAAGALAPAQQSKGASANQLYKQGVLAMKQGEVDTAKQCFEAALKIQPSHAHARYQLKQLPHLRGSLLARKRELQLQKVTIPSVDFDEATLEEALESLNTVIGKETEEKFSPNFIVQDPNGVLEDRTFSLKLGKVPASQVLKYALESTGASARFEEHAIVIQPRGKGGKAAEGRKAEPDKAAKPEQKPAADPFGR